MRKKIAYYAIKFMKTESDILQNFARNVRFYRERAGLSQEKLAEYSGLHRTYIGSIERLEKSPSLISALKIANALNVNISLLIE